MKDMPMWWWICISVALFTLGVCTGGAIESGLRSITILDTLDKQPTRIEWRETVWVPAETEADE